jgi:hypothetical protein
VPATRLSRGEDDSRPERGCLDHETGARACRRRSRHEIDHVIPLALGGADSDADLWPQPRRSIEPEWNAERKDRLEWRVADMVCNGQLDLAVAQEGIRDDWVDAYQTYMPTALTGIGER